MSAFATIPHIVVRRAKNLRIVRVASRSRAARFAAACKREGLAAQYRLGRSKSYWYVQVTRPEVSA